MILIITTLILSIIGISVCFMMATPATVFMPLIAKPDDPIIKTAVKKAKDTLGEGLKLYKKFPENALVKIKYVSNKDQEEYLWAELLSQEGKDKIKVRFKETPLTQEGHFEKICTCSIEDIQDWAVKDDENMIYGAYSERALFDIAERDKIKLPKKLLLRKKQYRDL